MAEQLQDENSDWGGNAMEDAESSPLRLMGRRKYSVLPPISLSTYIKLLSDWHGIKIAWWTSLGGRRLLMYFWKYRQKTWKGQPRWLRNVRVSPVTHFQVISSCWGLCFQNNWKCPENIIWGQDFPLLASSLAVSKSLPKWGSPIRSLGI